MEAIPLPLNQNRARCTFRSSRVTVRHSPGEEAQHRACKLHSSDHILIWFESSFPEQHWMLLSFSVARSTQKEVRCADTCEKEAPAYCHLHQRVSPHCSPLLCTSPLLTCVSWKATHVHAPAPSLILPVLTPFSALWGLHPLAPLL